MLVPITLATVPWLPLLISVPLLAAITAFVLPKLAKPIALTALMLNFFGVVCLGFTLSQLGVQTHALSGLQAPLGIGLHADGLSVFMLTATALVGLAVTVYASAYLSAGQTPHFWPLWLLLLVALNALFLSRDLFNIYVTLELVGMTSATLAAQKGGAGALAGAMRYLLVALLGSLVYLLGVAFIYHAYGTLAIDLLSNQVTGTPATQVAFGLMAVGLLLKTALFPLHFWLPAAHASAAAPVSALLSALVVKASFYLLVRLWLDIFAPISSAAGSVFAALGAGAVLWGSLQALRQTRIKLLVAYSTVAQLGYLFLAFPLFGSSAWQGIVYLALAHALAKSAMFLAAGNITHFTGRDTIAELDSLAQRLPVTVAAFAIAGVSLMGLPPSGGFIGKWLFLQSAIAQKQWALAAVIVGGGVLTAAYVFKVIGSTFTSAAAEQSHPPQPVANRMEWAAMALACAAVALGFVAQPLLEILAIGSPFAAMEVPR